MARAQKTAVCREEGDMKRDQHEVHRLQTLLDAVEQAILHMPEKELPPESEEQIKHDEKTLADIFDAALKAFGRRKLDDARRGLAEVRAAQAAARERLPGSPELRRQLLKSIVTRNADRIPEEFTIAFRDGREVTAAEVDSILAALVALGVIDNGGKPK